MLGHDVATEGARIRALVGYMPEHDCLPADVSASDLVVHMGQMSGLPYAAARERAADVLRHVGLAEERYRPMGGYSTGMKQRAKLAQALVHDPRLVLLDEPTNGLDPSSRDDMLALVRRIGTEFGIAVLVTSHLLGELERVSDHVVVLDGGRLLRSSATVDFLHRTGSLLVEVQGGPDADRLLGQALVDAGLGARPADGRLIEVEIRDEATPDVVRDLTVELGLGLVRMQERHHRIEDVFREGGAGQCPTRLTPLDRPAPPPSSTTSATGPTPGHGSARAPSRGRSSSPGCGTPTGSGGRPGRRCCRCSCSA